MCEYNCIYLSDDIGTLHHVSDARRIDVFLQVAQHGVDPLLVRDPVHQLEHELKLLRLVTPYVLLALCQNRLFVSCK